MKKRLLCILLIMVVAVLAGGCSLFSPTVTSMKPEDVEKISAAQAIARKACEDRLKEEFVQKVALMSRMTQDQAYNFMIMDGYKDSSRQSMQLTGALIGYITKGKVRVPTGQCDETNVWDYLAASDTAKFELAGKIIDGTFNVAETWLRIKLGDNGDTSAGGNGNIIVKGDNAVFTDVNNKKNASGEATLTDSSSGSSEKQTKIAYDKSAVDGQSEPVADTSTDSVDIIPTAQ